MPTEPPPRHILIDFENVPHTTLAPLAGLPVEVTLLVGEKNKRLGTDLVEQLLAAGSRVHFVRVGASGRNALDLTLAYYLGRAAVQSPRTEFFIVSRDGDYDAMIGHAERSGVIVSRHGSIDELPFLAPVRATNGLPRTSDRYTQILEHLRAHRDGRPRRQATLHSYLKAQNALKLTDEEVARHIERLKTEGHIAVSDKSAVTYHL